MSEDKRTPDSPHDDYDIYDEIPMGDGQNETINGEDDIYWDSNKEEGQNNQNQLYDTEPSEKEADSQIAPKASSLTTTSITTYEGEDEHAEGDAEPQFKGDKQIKPEDKALVFTNLAWWTTDKQIEDLLSPFGKVKRIRFVESKTNGKSKGTCLVMFENSEDAMKAIQKVKTKDIDGKLVKIALASIEEFEQLNTHNRGRKERREYAAAKKGSGDVPSGGRGNYQGRGRGSYRGRGAPFGRGFSEGMPPGGEMEDFGPPSRGPRYPFPSYLPSGVPGYAPHVNPAFFPKYPSDTRDWGREREREREREPRDRRDKDPRDREKEERRDKREKPKDREKERSHSSRKEKEDSKESSRKRKRERDDDKDEKKKKEKHSSRYRD